MIRTTTPPRTVLALAVILVLAACGGAAEGESPQEVPVIAESLDIVVTEALPAPTQGATSRSSVPPASLPTISPVQPAIPERRRITLEFPPTIRIGDSDVVRLTLEVDDLGNLTPTAEIDGNVVTGKIVEIPNLYDTHHVIAEARFDIAGLEVAPPDLVSQPLAQGQSVTFLWSILPEGAGNYRGTIWLYLHYLDKVSREESQKTVSAQSVDIEAVNFLGFSGSFARSFGLLGSVVGTVIGFPFLEDIVKFLFKNRGSR